MKLQACQYVYDTSMTQFLQKQTKATEGAQNGGEGLGFSFKGFEVMEDMGEGNPNPSLPLNRIKVRILGFCI